MASGDLHMALAEVGGGPLDENNEPDIETRPSCTTQPQRMQSTQSCLLVASLSLYALQVMTSNCRHKLIDHIKSKLCCDHRAHTSVSLVTALLLRSY